MYARPTKARTQAYQKVRVCQPQSASRECQLELFSYKEASAHWAHCVEVRANASTCNTLKRGGPNILNQGRSVQRDGREHEGKSHVLAHSQRIVAVNNPI